MKAQKMFIVLLLVKKSLALQLLDNSPVQKSISLYKNFLAAVSAKKLRREFEDVYRDPRHTPQKRFAWDHWSLDNQYRMHRTLAQDFFSPKSYDTFKKQLIRFGQDHLGCHSVSEPWLSYYTEGDEQQLHTDSPHGPWAYVYSLTPKFNFTGGETLILKPQTLDYWAHFSRERGYELNDLVEQIPARFNQLLVFDPRLPHGVRRVSGVHNPSDARLVIHGWFVNPEPYVYGGLKMSKLSHVLNRQIASILAHIQVPPTVFGILAWKIKISSAGNVTQVDALTNSLIDRLGVSTHHFTLRLQSELKHITFPKAAKASILTLPLIFD